MSHPPIYTLSMWQPWASLLVLGCKQFETRHWPIPQNKLPRETAIHAAGRWTRDQRELCEQNTHIRAALIEHAPTLARQVNCGAHYLPHVNLMLGDVAISLPLGCLIGMGAFVSCWQTELVITTEYITPAEAAMGNYEPGRFAFRFYDAQLITPIPMHGKQSWWRVARPQPMEVRKLK
jgi:hypothetical protein